MKRNMTRRKLNTIFLFVIFFTFSFISIGYSALQQELTISGDIAFEHYEPTLYDVLKKEAKHNGLAREYTGEHGDSMAGVGTQKIYHWYADNDTDGTAIQDKNNVVFANHCWQMIRTTDTGGVKMIYNGEAENNQCLNTRGNHVGYVSLLPNYGLSNSYWYGTDYTYDSTNQVFSIAGTTEQATLSEATASNLIGKYTCRKTTEAGTCTTLYLVESYYNTSKANVIQLNASSHYSQFGKLEFNEKASSPVATGYMYNTMYQRDKKEFYFSENMFDSMTLDAAFWYADDISYDISTGEYSLVNPYQASNMDDYQNLVGKYTFRNETQTYTGISVYYIVAVNNTTMYCFKLNDSGNHTLSDFNYTYTYGESFTDNGDGTYTINNPTTVQRTDWHTSYSNVDDKYVCKNTINDTCSELWYATSTYYSSMAYIKVTNNYKYAKGFTWDGSKYVLDNDTSVTFWNFSDSTNRTSLYNAHYTCWNVTGECTTISYINEAEYVNGPVLYYIDIANGKSVEEALNEMFNSDGVNSINSTIKSGVDAWYKKYILPFDSYVEDTIFCSDRSIRALGGWDSNGGIIGQYLPLQFKEYNVTSDLSCTNITDRFSTTNPRATLTYKVGIMSSPEANILNNANALKTGQNYWLASPSSYGAGEASNRYVNTNGSMNRTAGVSTVKYGVRPVISLNPGTEYYAGDGSMANPYIVSDYIHNTNFSESAISGGTKNVTITFPSGCGSTLTCTYKKDNGSDVSVTTSSVVVPFTSAGGLTTAVTKPNGTSLTNSYIVKFNALYVSSSGNDTTGNGSISNPYATLIKAYNMAENTATIYAMNNLTATDTTTLNKNKNITLTSCTKSGDTCPTSSANSIIRDSSFTDNYLLDIQKGTMNLSTITIDGNDVASSSAMINVDSTLIINTGATLKKANHTGDGGAIFSNEGNINLNGGTITNNSATRGGGIFNTFGTTTISSGTVSYNNSSTSTGGGIWTAGNINITGGSINNNTAKTGGGINCSYSTPYEKKCTMTMSGGSINSNTSIGDASSSGGGGGLYINSDYTYVPTVTITGGEIKNNKSNTSCTESSCYAGGGAIINFGNLTLGAVTISNNEALTGGGAIQNANTLTISGATISSNTAGYGGAINNTSQGNHHGNITINSVTMNSNKAVKTNGKTGTGGAIISSTGIVKITGGTFNGNTSAGVGGAIYLNINSSGETYTSSSTTMGKLNINGGTISNNTSTASGGGIYINYDSTHQNVCTISGSTSIKGNKSTESGGGGIVNRGILKLQGGTITGNTAYTYGGGIFTSEKLEMTGGTIGGNSTNANKATTASGGGIYMNGGTATISAGTISYNTAATIGGGIYLYGATATISGTTAIRYNEATSNGGGIFASSHSTITISAGTIGNNKSGRAGGGMYVNSNTTATVKGTTTFSSNTSASSGGGIYVTADGTLNLNAGTISSNTSNADGTDSAWGGGGIATNGTVNMSGGTIASNKALSGRGGGVRLGASGVFKLTGGVIKKNTASVASGGIDVHSSATYTRTAGYVCKNNNPTNTYDVTATTNTNCS